MLIQKSDFEDPNFCLEGVLSEMLAIPLVKPIDIQNVSDS